MFFYNGKTWLKGWVFFYKILQGKWAYLYYF